MVNDAPGIRIERGVWERALRLRQKALEKNIPEALSPQSWFSALIMKGMQAEEIRKLDEE
jgi:hypothetical protein